MTALLVVVGAVAGAPLRYLTDLAVQSRHDSVFPWGTLAVNAGGSLVLGAVAGAVSGGAPARVHLGGGGKLVRRRPSLADDLGFLLLGEAEDLLDAGTEPGVGGTLLLTDLPVRIRQFLLEGLDLVTVLTQIGFELVEVLVDRVGVVPAHDLGEVAGRCCVFEEVAELSVDFRLHLA